MEPTEQTPLWHLTMPLPMAYDETCNIILGSPEVLTEALYSLAINAEGILKASDCSWGIPTLLPLLRMASKGFVYASRFDDPLDKGDFVELWYGGDSRGFVRDTFSKRGLYDLGDDMNTPTYPEQFVLSECLDEAGKYIDANYPEEYTTHFNNFLKYFNDH
jgi:hypothetical protein